MYQSFLKFIREQELIDSKDKLLLGVSGGVDSVVLTELIDQLGNEYALAHCNFNLRGKESDDDENFVVNLADQKGVKCLLSSFSTREYAREKGISVEMAARELRYDWFEKLCLEKGYNKIIVGHHLDDVLETFVLNLSRSTGIRGLSGIKAIHGKIVRPLLFATRKEIESYAKENELLYRNDSTNEDISIKRNRVRHRILPEMEYLNPSFKQNLNRSIQYLHETEILLNDAVQKAREKLFTKKNKVIRVDSKGLLKLHPRSLYLFELLREFNFNSDVVSEIENALSGLSGTQFFSDTHRLIIDRDNLLITAIETKARRVYYIEKNDKFIHEPEPFKISVERYHPDYKIPVSEDVAVFDYDSLNFPLLIRHWKKGEYFRPLGMSGFKKLSDFYVNEKFSLLEKENTWLLTSDNKIVWVIGKRIDDRFKITENTKLIYRIERIIREDENKGTL